MHSRRNVCIILPRHSHELIHRQKVFVTERSGTVLKGLRNIVKRFKDTFHSMYICIYIYINACLHSKHYKTYNAYLCIQCRHLNKNDLVQICLWDDCRLVWVVVGRFPCHRLEYPNRMSLCWPTELQSHSHCSGTT